MLILGKGRLTARFAETKADLAAAQALRHRAFFEQPGAVSRAERLDQDPFDALCRHVLVEEAGLLVGCFRILELASGAAIGSSYSAQSYDLAALTSYPGPMMELGRFCIAPESSDPDILRLAWAALTRLVDAAGVTLLFGCSSFAGAEPAPHLGALTLLRERHLAPPLWAPKRRAREVVGFADLPPVQDPPMAATRGLPPLLRSYLAMGGWVSDHAVVDREMNTLHVFTGLEIARVPAARARLLRASAG